MSDELDPDLRRLFADTAEYPSDEAFVSAVTGATSREHRLWTLVRALGGGLALAVLLAATALGLPAFVQIGNVVTPLVTTGPLGWIAGLALALAGVVCVRTVAPALAGAIR